MTRNSEGFESCIEQGTVAMEYAERAMMTRNLGLKLDGLNPFSPYALLIIKNTGDLKKYASGKAKHDGPPLYTGEQVAIGACGFLMNETDDEGTRNALRALQTQNFQ